MKIQLNTGVVRDAASDVAQLLIDAGLARVAPPEPATPPSGEWYLSAEGQLRLDCPRCKNSHGVLSLAGYDERRARDILEHRMAWCCGKRKYIPGALIERYLKNLAREAEPPRANNFNEEAYRQGTAGGVQTRPV